MSATNSSRSCGSPDFRSFITTQSMGAVWLSMNPTHHIERHDHGQARRSGPVHHVPGATAAGGGAPVVLVNMFSVPEGTVDQAVAKWKDDAEFMKHQPGYISAQLHRGTGESHLLVNIAVWESTETLVRAFSSPEFQGRHDGWPDGTIAYPHLFQKVAVEG